MVTAYSPHETAENFYLYLRDRFSKQGWQDPYVRIAQDRVLTGMRGIDVTIEFKPEKDTREKRERPVEVHLTKQGSETTFETRIVDGRSFHSLWETVSENIREIIN